MRMRPLFIWGAGIAATCAALLTGWRYAQLLAIEGANHLSVLVGEQARTAIRNFLQTLLSGEDIQASGKQEQIQEEF